MRGKDKSEMGVMMTMQSEREYEDEICVDSERNDWCG